MLPLSKYGLSEVKGDVDPNAGPWTGRSTEAKLARLRGFADKGEAKNI